MSEGKAKSSDQNMVSKDGTNKYAANLSTSMASSISDVYDSRANTLEKNKSFENQLSRTPDKKETETNSPRFKDGKNAFDEPPTDQGGEETKEK